MQGEGGLRAVVEAVAVFLVWAMEFKANKQGFHRRVVLRGREIS